jgi:hypothetical protein
MDAAPAKILLMVKYRTANLLDNQPSAIAAMNLMNGSKGHFMERFNNAEVASRQFLHR